MSKQYIKRPREKGTITKDHPPFEITSSVLSKELFIWTLSNYGRHSIVL